MSPVKRCIASAHETKLTACFRLIAAVRRERAEQLLSARADAVKRRMPTVVCQSRRARTLGLSQLRTANCPPHRPPWRVLDGCTVSRLATEGDGTWKRPGASEWLSAMSARLQQQWPTIDPTRLDDPAFDLWRAKKLRALPPEQAADEWLRPVVPGAESRGGYDGARWQRIRRSNGLTTRSIRGGDACAFRLPASTATLRRSRIGSASTCGARAASGAC